LPWSFFRRFARFVFTDSMWSSYPAAAHDRGTSHCLRNISSASLRNGWHGAARYFRRSKRISWRHHWPGNVRELENTITRACARFFSQVPLPADIPLGLRREEPPPPPQPTGWIAINLHLPMRPLMAWLSRQVAGVC
jgi:hypothetical protein